MRGQRSRRARRNATERTDKPHSGRKKEDNAETQSTQRRAEKRSRLYRFATYGNLHSLTVPNKQINFRLFARLGKNVGLQI
jgi:hypothetical protein